MGMDLMQLLNQKEEGYLRTHPRTGELDVQIVRSVWQGRSVVRVAQEIPCSESTVYRSLRRVKEYLLGKGVYAQVLRRFVEEHPPNFGDGEAGSILEMLFVHYEEFNRFDTDEIQANFAKLYQELDGMSLRQLDRVIDTACMLCRNHEMAGFVEGVKVGVRMGMELEA